MAGWKGIDPKMIQQLLATFRPQLEERANVISEGLLALERGHDADGRVPLLESMFRAAHNIKGAARGIGLERCAELAHAVEDLLAAWKRGELAVEPSAVDLCLSALDALRPLVDAESFGNGMDERTRQLMRGLRAAAQGRPSVLPPAAAPNAPPPPIPSGGDSVRLPVDRLDRIADLAEELQVAKIGLDDHHLGSRRLFGLAGRLRHLLERMAAPGRGPPHVRAAPMADLLSDSLDLALELEQLAKRQQTGLHATASLLRPVAGTLREDARALRMVPAATVLVPLTRAVRDLARELGKEARLALTGEHIEMDRAILEALRDPLMHLVHNAVDHGIELPGVRRARGKPEAGRVEVALTREGGKVRITVADDGAGIEPESLRKEAARHGLSSGEELVGMNRQALFDLLFRSGFSTRTEVGAISGRGVGLDVVRVSLQALRGRVSVESEPGAGASFHLDVPLTLASERGLWVRAGGQLFALPNQYVTRILELAPEDIVDLEASQVIILGKEPVPLRDLAALLRLGEVAPPLPGEPVRVVAINRGWERVALRVDHVQGEREMVVRPLAPPLDRARFFAGGTLGLEGDIVLVLEPADLLAAALAPASGGRVVKRVEARRAAPRILVVDDSITTRTLEESILTGAGYRVTVAVDGESAWDKLRRDSFDLVVTDIEMPGMNGFDLTRRIKQDERLAQLPVVIVTSLGSDEDRRRGMEAQADAYIVKSSFESRELLEVIGQLL
ncbi:MAG: response regulator [Rhodocyclaceae bacterium]|nr:response regulator [Rhodocyclaceae bacterium]